MKLDMGFDKQALKITYEVADQQNPVSMSLADINREVTDEALGQVVEALMTLIDGDFRRIFVTRVTVGAEAIA